MLFSWPSSFWSTDNFLFSASNNLNVTWKIIWTQKTYQKPNWYHNFWILLNTLIIRQNLAKPQFWRYMQKTTVWPLCSIFGNNCHAFRQIKNPHISSMQDTTRNIYTNFSSNWSSSVRGEEFWKIVNYDGQWTPSDDNRPCDLKMNTEINIARKVM